MWDKCNIIEPFHTKEVVKHVFLCSYGNYIWFLSFEYGQIPSWCLFHWLTKEIRNVTRKSWVSLDRGGMKVWSNSGMTDISQVMSGITAVMLSRDQTVRGYGIWTCTWNSCYWKCGPRSRSCMGSQLRPHPVKITSEQAPRWFRVMLKFEKHCCRD